MTFKRICFIINPAAGQPKPILHSINKVLRQHDVDWDVEVTTPHRSAEQLARRVVEKGFDLVVACGGDGTVKAVADGILGTRVPLAILHGGTGNALAYQLKIDADIEKAVELIVGRHRLQAVDVGRVVSGGRHQHEGSFLLRASTGLQHTLMETATRDLKDRFGNFAYVMASLQSLTSGDIKPITYHLTIDGKEFEAQGVTCMVANSAAVGGSTNFDFAPQVDPSDGLLDAFVFGADLQSFAAALTSAISADETVFPQRWKGHEISVRADPAQKVTLDGEPFEGMPPFTVTVERSALKVVVPDLTPSPSP